ncbi:hypothetical protein DU002_00005 [Corallincola holothuriorum]|uniref:Immunity protein 35 domain-containing protein n=2 Tax=Corallincola holothuriorum TaxID=2282215 RepID=A0A368NQV5_9GAMM|nr:hypothetical protein DU002_00005 [Corallincola holothuriorum]
MTKEEALKLVEVELGRAKDKCNPIDCVVLEKKTIEKPWGWVFFYQSKEYVETGNFIYMLGGNAPYIVNRHTGELSETGTCEPIEYYIEEYEKSLPRGT